MSTLAEHDQQTQFWRCLEEWTDSEAFQQRLQDEFPDDAAQWSNPLTRRRFLALMGASLMLAGVGGCSRPSRQKILPYVRQPEEITPGKPLFYATAYPHPGGALGILVESHTGRPTKIEGNPDHPASLGATDSFAQASILTLYDPDRSATIRYRGRPTTWVQARMALENIRQQLIDKKSSLHILTGELTSPTLIGQLRSLLETHGDRVRWYQHEPAGNDSEREGTRLVFGEPLHAIYDLREADVVVSLDAEFLASGPGHVRLAREFAERRRVVDKDREKLSLARLYVAESMPTGTGLFADHRFAMQARQVPVFAALLAEVPGVQAEESLRKKAAAVVRDLKKAGREGRTVIIPGQYQPPIVHALAHRLNQKLGNVGKTVRFVSPIGEQPRALSELTAAMAGGEVKNLLILDGNPVYDAPADLKFAEALEKVPLRIHLSLYDDETSRLCHWHIPATHYLEAWSDARAEDGTVTILQPLIAPLYESAHSAHEMLAALSDTPQKSANDVVREHWRKNKPAAISLEFEPFWQRSLHDGLMEGTRFESKQMSPKQDANIEAALKPYLTTSTGLEIVFRPDPTVYDGRFANNGWLQELPKPISKLVWDNAALMSPKTAKDHGLEVNHGLRGGNAFADVVELKLPGRDPIRAPVWIVPGHADDSVTVYLGHGRTRPGRVGKDVGFNAYHLRSVAAPWYQPGLEIKKTGDRSEMACTQLHQLIKEARRIIRAVPMVKNYQDRPRFAHEHGHPVEVPDRVPLSLHGDTHHYNGYKWGMAIDLSTCTGCGACVVACQAENNIPVVGKAEVLNGREMHWLRIDTYFEGTPEAPTQAYFQPLPCMHCEKAPCEVVCPVQATVHSSEGLNDMVYNRCVGTRYCSNNCPYKVRRFNFLQYSDYVTQSLKGMRNPDVTVRSRGVMEKCTYCVQRINQARITAETDGRAAIENKAGEKIKPIHDSELLTACQAACPSGSIVFGDLNNRETTVTKWAGHDLNYALLDELNTRPRTTYLAAVKNRNPELDRE